MKEEKRKRRVHNAQVGLWTALILTQMVVVHCLTVRAETAGGYEERRVYRDVVYEAVEDAAAVPETVEVQVRQSGQRAVAICRVKDKTVLREWWSEDFSFPVTFHTYDAEFYELGDCLIPYNEERPQLEGCELQLLNAIGVSPEAYEITQLQWVGDAYRDGEGKLCRDAVAGGRKLLRDYRVRYEGTAVFSAGGAPLTDQQEPETVEEDMPEDEAENTVEESKVSMLQKEEDSAQIELKEQEDERPAFWRKLTSTLLLIIGIGALLFFGGLLFLAFLWVVKKLRKWYTERRK